METPPDQRITELCRQVIETNTPLDKIQVLETGDERKKLIVAVRDKVGRLFGIETSFKDIMMGRIRNARGPVYPRVTKLPDIPAPGRR